MASGVGRKAGVMKNEGWEPLAEFSSQHWAALEASSPSPRRTTLEKPPVKILLDPFCSAPPGASSTHSATHSLSHPLTFTERFWHGGWGPCSWECLGRVARLARGPRFPQRCGIQRRVSLAVGEHQQKISDFEKPLRIVSSNL